MDIIRSIAQLRQNFPSQKGAYIYLEDRPYYVLRVQQLAQALEQHDYVDNIYLRVIIERRQPPPQHRWGDLLRVLATHEKLEKVVFNPTPISSEERSPITEEHAMFLRAVQENRCVQRLELERCNFGGGDIDGGEFISSLLDTASSPLTEFGLTRCSMTTQLAETIAASLQRNTNLRKLNLEGLEDSHFTVILQGLETNTWLQVLSLEGHDFHQAKSLVVQRLLERTASILCLDLYYDNFSLMLPFTEESLEPICQGLINSRTVSKVVFGGFRFEDPACANLFRQMIETKPNLQFLSIRHCSFPPASQGPLRDSLSAVLLRPNSSLRTLEFDLFSFSQGLPFGALLSAVGRSALERFSIQDIDSEERFQTLLSGLPVMKIRELEFRLGWRSIGLENRQGDVLRAVKRNFSLRSLKGSFDGRSFFTDDEDKLLLEFYLNRNERLEQWVANPATVPSLLWPDALGLALDAGEDPFYRGLQAVLGNEMESAQQQSAQQRKRKRQVNNDNDETV